MRIAVIGGGPAGLYFSLLHKKAGPADDVDLFEKNSAGATYGWGVVFSDRTLTSFREADYKTYRQITDDFIIWDAIDVHYRDRVMRCGGQVFSGIARKTLLAILQARCEELGVALHFEQEIEPGSALDGYDLVVAADGVHSSFRDADADVFRPRFDEGRSRYIWFGTDRVFDSFAFAFQENDHGFFQAHAYPFDGAMSTFIVECSDETWIAAGLDQADESTSIAYCEELFAKELMGHNLRSNNSKWINFVTLKNRTWRHGNLALVGDAAHTAHFSIGSGTKLAMEDSIALANALQIKPDVDAALTEYELDRKPRVERFQEAARQSQNYFENTVVYSHMEPEQFAFHLLSRSGRIDYDDLRVRDPHFVDRVDRWFTARTRPDVGDVAIAEPPAFAPLTVGDVKLPNRVAVVARPTYAAKDGAPVEGCLDAAARSGAGLVFTDIVAVSANGRITPGDPGLYDDAHTAAWKQEVAKVDAPCALTLGHSGPRGSTRPRHRYVDVALDAHEAWMPFAATPQTYSPRSLPAAAVDDQRMVEVLEDFVAAARRADDAGFDVLELHMAHGYLLATFLSPLTNPRPLDERLRFPRKVFDAIRSRWSKPLGVAINGSDWARDGTSLNDAVATALAFKERGCEFVKIVAGQTTGNFMPRYDPYFLTHYAERIRNRAGIATIATGDITTIDRVNTIVAGGRADLCLLRL